MSVEPVAPAMDQKIFSLGLAVETISAYLLCCALADAGRPVTLTDLRTVWTATTAALDKALDDLARHAIVVPADGAYRISPATCWRRP